jgi:hypothetical protein
MVVGRDTQGKGEAGLGAVLGISDAPALIIDSVMVINRSLTKWLLGCVISPYAHAPLLLLSVSSALNSFCTTFAVLS